MASTSSSLTKTDFPLASIPVITLRIFSTFLPFLDG